MKRFRESGSVADRYSSDRPSRSTDQDYAVTVLAKVTRLPQINAKVVQEARLSQVHSPHFALKQIPPLYSQMHARTSL